MSNERSDYPLPPHYYKEFDTPQAMAPPDLQAIVEGKNTGFFTFGAKESFFDNGEKIFPNYLENQPSMIGKKGIKEDLLDLINQLNFASTQYIQAIAQDPLKMKENKDKVSVILHNIFYLIKVIKAKYKARIDLAHIYKVEEERRSDLAYKKLDILRSIKNDIEEVKKQFPEEIDSNIGVVMTQEEEQTYSLL